MVYDCKHFLLTLDMVNLLQLDDRIFLQTLEG